MATSIEISDITSNVTTSPSYDVTGDGYFDDVMETINTHLKAQFNAGRITGDNYAKSYVALAQNALNQTIQFGLTKRSAELRADGLNEDVLKKQEDYAVQTGTDVRQAKIETALAQRDKVENEALYIAEQKTQLTASVGYNNKIKALDSLADTYGTFGAGGLTMSSDMWNTYFTIVADLSGATAPTSTTVTEV
jgi:hypothetical protein